MKRLIIYMAFCWALQCIGQGGITITEVPTIEIHQIDVGAGDATFIKVNAEGRTYAILIDAGDVGNANVVRDYIWGKANKLMDSTNMYLDLIMVSHYDEDHIGGLAGITKNEVGVMDYLDPDMSIDPVESRKQVNWVRHKMIEFYAVLDPGPNPGPPLRSEKGVVKAASFTQSYTKYCELAGGLRTSVGIPSCTQEVLTIPAQNNDGGYPSKANCDLRLGGKIPLGVDANGTEISLRLIASNGYVLSPTSGDNYATYDVASALGESRDPNQSSVNNNNWCLVWLLEYGQFRYFTGGDLSGVNDATLFDMETPLAQRMNKILPEPDEISGHVCALKLNHHGSKNSSNKEFITTLKPSLAGVSCGQLFDHPNAEVCEILRDARWTSPLFVLDYCSWMVLTQMCASKPFESERLLISGNKIFVKNQDVPEMVTTIDGNEVPKDDVLGSQRSNIPSNKYLAKRKRKFSEPNTFKTNKKIIYADTEIVKLVNTKHDIPVIDGDFVIKVYPFNSENESINDVSSMKLQIKKTTLFQWEAPIEVNCHRKELMPMEGVSK